MSAQPQSDPAAPAKPAPVPSRRRIVRGAALVLLLGGALFAWQLHRRHLAQEHLLYGNVDIREVNLGFRVPGKVIAILKDEGDQVQPGELLARLDPEPYRREVEQATAELESAHTKLALMEAGYRREEVQQARANAAEAEAMLTNAARVFTRKEELLAKKVSSQQEVDDARAARDAAEARVGAVRAALALQEAGFRPEEIAQSRAEVSRAEANLASAKLRLQDTELSAPSHGVVMTRAFERGAILSTGATLFTVSLTEPVWVRAYVHEPQLGDIHPGMKVTVTTDSNPDKTYRGQIGYISPQAEFTPKSVETAELRTSLVYRLRVVIENPGNDLRQGMPVTVRLPEN